MLFNVFPVRLNRLKDQIVYLLAQPSQTSLIAIQHPGSPAPGPPSTTCPHQRLLWVNASTVAVPDPLQPRRLPTLLSNRVGVVLLRQARKSHFILLLLSEPSIPCSRRILLLVLTLSRFCHSGLCHSFRSHRTSITHSFYSFGAGSYPHWLHLGTFCSPFTHLSSLTVYLITSLHPLACRGTTLSPRHILFDRQ